jgi:hypothetical protein
MMDILCLIGAGNCLVLLLFLKSPTTTVIATGLVNLLGTIPTLRHTWQKPYEEVWVTYGFYVLAEILTLFVADYSHPAAYIYPAFLLLEDTLLVLFILQSPNRRPASGTLPTLNWRAGLQIANASGIGNINPHLSPRLIVASVPVPGDIVQPGLTPAMAVPARAPADPPPPPPSYLPPSPPIAPGLPTIASPNSAAARVGAPFDFRIVATGNPVPTAINLLGTLPSGYNFANQGNGMAKIAGIASPDTQGTYPLSFSVTSPLGTISQRRRDLLLLSPTSDGNAQIADFRPPNHSVRSASAGFPICLQLPLARQHSDQDSHWRYAGCAGLLRLPLQLVVLHGIHHHRRAHG